MGFQLEDTPSIEEVSKPQIEKEEDSSFQVEGKESSGDLSIKWVNKNSKVQTIEKGIPFDEFEKNYKLRELSQEFKLIKKISETRAHSNQMITGRKTFNRYSDIGPYKHTCVSLP